MTLSKSNHFPKAPSPNTIILRGSASIYEFGDEGGDTIQSVATMMFLGYGLVTEQAEGWPCVLSPAQDI